MTPADTQDNGHFPIAASILAFDFARLGAQVTALAAAGVASFHFDVMDMHFVPNLSFGPLVLQALRPLTTLPFHAHLMTEAPERYIDLYAAAGAQRVYVHVEATPHINRVLAQVREAGMEPGVTLNPGTPIATLAPVMEMADAVLVMSVNPGFGGQAFLPITYRRLTELGMLAAELGVTPVIAVDGGVDVAQMRPLAAAGMTEAIIGTALFRGGDAVATLARLHEAVRG
jgi:ribulose-phosphate 3-epimerase